MILGSQAGLVKHGLLAVSALVHSGPRDYVDSILGIEDKGWSCLPRQCLCPGAWQHQQGSEP